MFKLSIIIPHFNSVPYLHKLLSTIPQKKEIQIIVVDDNSNQDLDAYNLMQKEPRYKHITFLTNNRGNKGAGTCRNIGLGIAQGEWVLFADADDYFSDDFYDIVSDYFDSENDVVFFTPTSIEPDTGNLSDRHLRYKKLIFTYLHSNSFENETQLRYGFPSPCSKLIHRKLLVDNNICFDEVLASNDVMFSAKVGYYLKRFQASEKIIYCMTRIKGSLTTNVGVDVFDARLMVHIRCNKFLTERISKKELEILNVSSRYLIIRAIKYKYGLKKILETYKILRINNLRVFDTRLLNPIYWINKAVEHYRFNRKFKELSSIFLKKNLTKTIPTNWSRVCYETNYLHLSGINLVYLACFPGNGRERGCAAICALCC